MNKFLSRMYCPTVCTLRWPVWRMIERSSERDLHEAARQLETYVFPANESGRDWAHFGHT